MRIKEVEQRTGLTAKAIRLYESKGLLSISREAENEYRDYSQEDVARLKTIALLRKMEIPVKTIKLWTDGEVTLQELLQDAAQTCREDSQASREKEKLAQALCDILQDCSEEELPEAAENATHINSLLQEFEKELRRGEADLMLPVWTTLITLGPVSFVVIYILEGQVERALLAFALSILSLTLCVLSWNNYLKHPKKERNGSGCLMYGLLAVAVLAATIGLAVGLTMLQQVLFVPDPQAVYVSRTFWLVFVIEVELACMLILGVKKALRKFRLTGKQLACFMLAVIALNGCFLYGFLTGVSVARETGITRHSFLCPQGREVAFEDVVLVETGFQGKLFGFLVTGQTGSFYYKLHYSDGTVEDWSQCQGEAYVESWQWMYAIDGWLMEAGVPKEGSTENSQYCDLDQEYVDIFLNIIDSKPAQ